MMNFRTSEVLLLLALSGVSRAQPSDAQIFDPNTFTEKEKQYIIDTYADDGLKQYARDTGCEIDVSNNLFQTYRFAPFVELLYANGTETEDGRLFYDVWNSDLVENQLNTIQEGSIDLSGDPPTIKNFNKRVMMDMNIMCFKTQADLGDLSLEKSYPFTSNENIRVGMKYFAPVAPAPGGKSYDFDTPSYVYRWNTFLYYPHTTIYTLARFDASDRLEIFVMQAFGNGVNNQYTPDQLLLNPVNANVSKTNPLTPSITPPEGAVFGFVRLDRYLMVPSFGRAQVISDNLGNAYQLVNRTAAPWLYDQYESGVRTESPAGATKDVSSSYTASVVSALIGAALLALV
jgi:hypothetical protein